MTYWPGKYGYGKVAVSGGGGGAGFFLVLIVSMLIVGGLLDRFGKK